MLKPILISLIIIFVSCNTTNKDYSIGNKTWDVCIKTDFTNFNNDCTYLITYVFNKNGTFYEFVKSSPDSIQKIQSKNKYLWEIKNDLLTIKVKYNGKEKIIEHKIYWINKSTFYTIEKNSNDITIKTYYKAQN